MQETAKAKLVDVGKQVLKDLEQDIATPEGCAVVDRAARAILAGVKVLVETASPGFAVPFEEMAFGWLIPHLQAQLDAKVASLRPAPAAGPAPVSVSDAAKVVAAEVK